MSSFLAPTYETRCSVQKLEKLSKTQIGMINTTMQAGSKTKHQAEEEEESNSSCHVVEDYLTNPYMLDHHIRVRSVSGSGAMSSQRSAEESGSFIRTPVINRLSTFRSRASSLSSYLTSSSSSSSTLSSLTLQSTPSRSSSISPSSISQSSPSSPIPCENTHQFWSKYKRTQSKSSLTDLVKKVTALQKLKT